MESSKYLAVLQAELAAITRVVSGDVARAAELLTEVLEPAIQLTMLDVLSAAAAEITSLLGGAVVEVRLAGGEATFVVTEHTLPDPPAEVEAADAEMTRVALRLPETLKARVEEAAARDGVSANTWLTQAIRRALEDRRDAGLLARRMPGQRITGFTRS
jgi:hypothetical protein